MSNIANQIPWNKVIVEEFITQAMLTTDEEWVLRTRVAGWSITKQSIELGMSVSTVNRIVAKLKKKYDRVSVNNPLLPPRKSSEKETWMDTH